MALILYNSDMSVNLDLAPIVQQAGFGITRSDITHSVQTMDGTTHVGRVASKAQLRIKVIPRNHTDISALLQILEDQPLTVLYEDPVLGQRYATFHLVERTADLKVHYRDGSEWWDPVEMTLRED